MINVNCRCMSVSKCRNCRATQQPNLVQDQRTNRWPGQAQKLWRLLQHGSNQRDALSEESITRMQQLHTIAGNYMHCINRLSQILFFSWLEENLAVCLNLWEVQEKWHRKTGGPSVISSRGSLDVSWSLPVDPLPRFGHVWNPFHPFLQFSVSCRDQELAATSPTCKTGHVMFRDTESMKSSTPVRRDLWRRLWRGLGCGSSQ